jgi:hypothetical protein
MIFAGIKGFVDIFSIRNQKKEWIENAVPVQVSIVDREEAYDDYVADWDYKLKIRFPPEIITEPDEQIIWAGVSAEIYKRYSGQHKARIYYSAAKPGQFILDGEQYS